MSLERELEKILEDNNGEEWKKHAIKLLALSSLKTLHDLSWIKFIISAILALIVGQLLAVVLRLIL
ncbi:hypothetical protein J7J18_01560 [bacterium]|nr:hypothetical protein [bacterium]